MRLFKPYFAHLDDERFKRAVVALSTKSDGETKMTKGELYSVLVRNRSIWHYADFDALAQISTFIRDYVIPNDSPFWEAKYRDEFGASFARPTRALYYARRLRQETEKFLFSDGVEQITFGMATQSPSPSLLFISLHRLDHRIEIRNANQNVLNALLNNSDLGLFTDSFPEQNLIRIHVPEDMNMTTDDADDVLEAYKSVARPEMYASFFTTICNLGYLPSGRPVCAECQSENVAAFCGGCHFVAYCTKECADTHWKKNHHGKCKRKNK